MCTVQVVLKLLVASREARVVVMLAGAVLGEKQTAFSVLVR